MIRSLSWGRQGVRAILRLVLTLFTVSSLVFFILRIIPGDPARAVLGMQADQAAVEEFQSRHGLDKPIVYQYLSWLTGSLALDFGTSFANGRPVFQAIAGRLGVTVFLALGGMVCALVIALPGGVAGASKPWTARDSLLMAVAHGIMAFPEFWIAMVLVLVFSVGLGILPLFGSGSPAHFILPIVALGLNRAPVLFRAIRGALIQEAAKPYVLFYYGAGVSSRRIMWRFLLPNAALSLVTMAAIQFGYLLGGAVIVEQVFALPGLGRLLLSSITARDLPVIQGGVFLAAGVFSLVGILADTLQGLLFPQLRRGRQG